MFTCACGKEIKTKAALISHAKACDMVKAFKEGLYKVIRPGVYRPYLRW